MILSIPLILELYTYLVKIWEQNCCSTENDNEIYPNGNNWNWDSESRSTANAPKHIFTSFEKVVVLLLSKELVDQFAECLQGQLQEVYFGFQKN